MKPRFLRVDDASLIPFALQKALALVARRGVSEQFPLAAGTIRLWRDVDDVVRIWIEAGSSERVPVLSLAEITFSFFPLPSGVALPSGFAISSDWEDFPLGAFGPTAYPPSEYWDPDISTGFAYAKIYTSDLADEHILAIDTLDISFHAGAVVARWVKSSNPGMTVSVLPAISDIGLAGYDVEGGASSIAIWTDEDGRVHAARAFTYSETTGSGQKATAIEHFQSLSGNAWTSATESVKGFGPLSFGVPSAFIGSAGSGFSPGGAIFGWPVSDNFGGVPIGGALDIYSSKSGRASYSVGRQFSFQKITVSDDATKWLIGASAWQSDFAGMYRDGIDVVVIATGSVLSIQSGTGFTQFGPGLISEDPKGRMINNAGQYVFPLSTTVRAEDFSFRFRQGYVIGGAYVELDNLPASGGPGNYDTVDRWAAISDDGRLAIMSLPKPVGTDMRRRYLIFFDGALVKTITYVTSNVTETSMLDARLTFVSSATVGGVEKRIYQLEQLDSDIPGTWLAHRVEVENGAVVQTTFERRRINALYVFGQQFGLPYSRQPAIAAWGNAGAVANTVGFRFTAVDTSL